MIQEGAHQAPVLAFRPSAEDLQLGIGTYLLNVTQVCSTALYTGWLRQHVLCSWHSRITTMHA